MREQLEARGIIVEANQILEALEMSDRFRQRRKIEESIAKIWKYAAKLLPAQEEA